ACLVFAPIGLALGLHTRREGKLAGMTMGLAVVGGYYAIMIQAEAWTKGYYSGVQGGALWNAGHVLPAYMARWIPNIAVGLVGVAALLAKRRAAGRGLQIRLPRWLLRKGAGQSVAAEAPARSTGRVVVVLRVPTFHLPRPRLLDVYVSRTYLRMGLLAFVALLGLYYLGAFLDRIEKLFKGQATSELMFQFLWYSTPQFVAFIVPLATLVAGLGTIGALSRTGELTIMRASGVSLYRAAMPLLFFATVWSGMLFVLDDRVVARANQRADALDNMIRGLPPHTENVLENRHWLVAKDGSIYYYQFYDARNRRLHNLSVFEPSAKPPYRLLSHAHAVMATFERSSGQWIAERGWIQTFPSADRSRHEAFAKKSLALEQPEQFESAQVDTEVMTYAQLREYINQRKAIGFSLSDQQMSLQRKLAFPAVTIVMTLLAVPFGVTTGKRGALYGIGLAIVLAVAYFLVTAFFNAAGRAGVLPAWFAAWAANILFLSAAAYLTLRVRT
ncbi:MAG TPA: LptF/LptG family permease, partial [Vicinamibacterales bacterium]|nr:LptF/LptG family permease [Vicinamibacterales bacterium]